MSEPTDKTLEALYNINKHARKYAELGTENYENGKKATARSNSVKKTALYELKSAVLQEIQSHASDVRLHTINGREFYCLFFDSDDTWSFHTPVEDFSLDDTLSVSESSVLTDFDKQSEKEHSNMALKTALLHFQSEFDLIANNFLPQQYVGYGRQSYFAGWSYLGDDD